MGESDEKKSKTGVLEWIKTLMPVVTIIVAGLFTVFVTNRINSDIQIRENASERELRQRSNDIAIAGMVVDVLEKRSEHLYDWLPTLVATIESKPLQDAMLAGVKSNRAIPLPIKQAAQNKVGIVQTQSEKPDLGQVNILYYEADRVLAEKVNKTLTNEGYTCKLVVSNKPPRMRVPEGFRFPMIIYPDGKIQTAQHIKTCVSLALNLELDLKASKDLYSLPVLTYEANKDVIQNPSQLERLFTAMTPSTYPIIVLSDWSR